MALRPDTGGDYSNLVTAEGYIVALVYVAILIFRHIYIHKDPWDKIHWDWDYSYTPHPFCTTPFYLGVYFFSATAFSFIHSIGLFIFNLFT